MQNACSALIVCCKTLQVLHCNIPTVQFESDEISCGPGMIISPFISMMNISNYLQFSD